MELEKIVWWYRILFGLAALLTGGAVLILQPDLGVDTLYKGLLCLYILLGIELLLGILLDMDKRHPLPDNSSNKNI